MQSTWKQLSLDAVCPPSRCKGLDLKGVIGPAWQGTVKMGHRDKPLEVALNALSLSLIANIPRLFI